MRLLAYSLNIYCVYIYLINIYCVNIYLMSGIESDIPASNHVSDLFFNDELEEIENLMDKLDNKEQGIDCEDEQFVQQEEEKYVGERIDIINNDEEMIIDPDVIICGIDLGTSNSCITIWRNNKPEVIPDCRGNLTIPSFVSFGNCSRYIGIEAKNQSELNPENTYYEVKRLIGRLYKERNVQLDKAFFTYDIEEGDNGEIKLLSTKGLRTKYSPEEIISMILSELKNNAETYLKQKISKVVITVPAYFHDVQRTAIINACKIVNLECVRIINEPTAAALAYGFVKNDKSNSTILVYDLGGGTLDVSIMKLDTQKWVFKVLASNGNTHLGGSDFDHYLMEYCTSEFIKKYNIDEIKAINSSSLQLLKKRCEQAKHVLSIKKNATVAIKNYYDNKDLCVVISREKFEELCNAMFILCLKPVEDAIKSCGLDIKDIDDVILVGGSTRIPKIKQNLEYYFGKKPNSSVNPDTIVSIGASIQAYIMNNKNDPYSTKVTLLDVLPLSLGIETMREVMTTIIPRNSIIPIKKTKKFYSDEDEQTSITIKVYEGERKLTKDNYLIGTFELTDLEPAPKELQQILVTFEVGFDGLIEVTAVDKRNDDNIKSIKITSKKSQLSEDEIKDMIKESVEWSIYDKLTNEIKRLRFEINDLCKIILKNVNDMEFQLHETDRKDVRNDVMNVIEFLKNDDLKNTQLIDVLKRIKANYGTLVLVKNKNADRLSAVENTNQGVSIFNNDNDSINVSEYQKIELRDILSEKLSDEDKNKILDIREKLTCTCYEMYELINSDKNNISTEDRVEMSGKIDDVLTWIHVTEQATGIDEYIKQCDGLNDHINKVMENYKEKEVFKKENIVDLSGCKTVLEQTCYALLTIIQGDIMPLDDGNKKVLIGAIEETLEWLENNDEVCEERCSVKKQILDELSQLVFDDIKHLRINTEGIIKNIELGQDVVYQLDA
jgi:heat shock protein 1/8